MSVKSWRSFGDARDHARSLGFRRLSEWRAYVDGDVCPRDIPKYPWSAYADEWNGLRDWLTKMMTYEEAKVWLREHGIRNGTELKRGSDAGSVPWSIPKYPELYYRKTGEWKGYDDFFTEHRKQVLRYRCGSHKPKYVSYEEFVRLVGESGVKTRKEYFAALRLGRMLDCPINPEIEYRDCWRGWGVISGRRIVQKERLLSFEDARALARKMATEFGLCTKKDYISKCRELIRSGSLPSGLSVSPKYVYSGKGWRGWCDWLGCRSLTARRSIHECVELIRGMGIRNRDEWNLRRLELPIDVYHDIAAYHEAGYWGKDLFGEQYENSRKSHFVPYAEAVIEARRIASELGITKSNEWHRAKGRGLPSYPPDVYRDNGWIDWKDWLGVKPKDFAVGSFDPLTVRQDHVVYQSRKVEVEIEERWVDVWTLCGYEWAIGYRVSNFGRVYVPSKDKIVIGNKVGGSEKRKTEHLGISMVGNPRDGIVLVHRLVATAFIPNPDSKPVVNHIDGNPQNNVSWNLEWVTQRENNYHAILTGLRHNDHLDDVKVYEIKRLLVTKAYNVNEIARRYGLSGCTIKAINFGRAYRYIGKESEFVYPLNGQVQRFRVAAEIQGAIKRRHAEGVSFRELMKEFSLSKETVYAICHAGEQNDACPVVDEVSGRVTLETDGTIR